MCKTFSCKIFSCRRDLLRALQADGSSVVGRIKPILADLLSLAPPPAKPTIGQPSRWDRMAVDVDPQVLDAISQSYALRTADEIQEALLLERIATVRILCELLLNDLYLGKSSLFSSAEMTELVDRIYAKLATEATVVREGMLDLLWLLAKGRVAPGEEKLVSWIKQTLALSPEHDYQAASILLEWLYVIELFQEGIMVTSVPSNLAPKQSQSLVSLVWGSWLVYTGSSCAMPQVPLTRLLAALPHSIIPSEHAISWWSLLQLLQRIFMIEQPLVLLEVLLLCHQLNPALRPSLSCPVASQISLSHGTGMVCRYVAASIHDEQSAWQAYRWLVEGCNLFTQSPPPQYLIMGDDVCLSRPCQVEVVSGVLVLLAGGLKGTLHGDKIAWHLVHSQLRLMGHLMQTSLEAATCVSHLLAVLIEADFTLIKSIQDHWGVLDPLYAQRTLGFRLNRDLIEELIGLHGPQAEFIGLAIVLDCVSELRFNYDLLDEKGILMLISAHNIDNPALLRRVKGAYGRASDPKVNVQFGLYLWRSGHPVSDILNWALQGSDPTLDDLPSQASLVVNEHLLTLFLSQSEVSLMPRILRFESIPLADAQLKCIQARLSLATPSERIVLLCCLAQSHAQECAHLMQQDLFALPSQLKGQVEALPLWRHLWWNPAVFHPIISMLTENHQFWTVPLDAVDHADAALDVFTATLETPELYGGEGLKKQLGKSIDKLVTLLRKVEDSSRFLWVLVERAPSIAHSLIAAGYEAIPLGMLDQKLARKLLKEVKIYSPDLLPVIIKWGVSVEQAGRLFDLLSLHTGVLIPLAMVQCALAHAQSLSAPQDLATVDPLLLRMIKSCVGSEEALRTLLFDEKCWATIRLAIPINCLKVSDLCLWQLIALKCQDHAQLAQQILSLHPHPSLPLLPLYQILLPHLRSLYHLSSEVIAFCLERLSLLLIKGGEAQEMRTILRLLLALLADKAPCADPHILTDATPHLQALLMDGLRQKLTIPTDLTQNLIMLLMLIEERGWASLALTEVQSRMRQEAIIFDIRDLLQ